MDIRQLECKSILRKQKKIDSWFLSSYGINLYRGCSHDCVYCDGRAERYRVDGEFGKTITVKTNAIQVLNRELDPARKRKTMKQGFVMLGGGVSDAYQSVEDNYQLARKTLFLIEKYNHPVHILTKSLRVSRDIDLLKRIQRNKPVLVSFSFSSVDEKLSRLFEPGVPSPAEKLDLIRRLKDQGISCGIFLMPLIPFLSDTPEQVDMVFSKAAEVGIDFIVFGGMTLKEGIQKQYFYKLIKNHYSDLLSRYQSLYSDITPWGNASDDYYTEVNRRCFSIAERYRIPIRIPPSIYSDLISGNDRIIVILEHLDYLLRLKNRTSSYGYVAYALSKLGKSVSSSSDEELLRLRGIGPSTLSMIREIDRHGRCRYLEDMVPSYRS